MTRIPTTPEYGPECAATFGGLRKEKRGAAHIVDSPTGTFNCAS